MLQFSCFVIYVLSSSSRKFHGRGSKSHVATGGMPLDVLILLMSLSSGPEYCDSVLSRRRAAFNSGPT